MNRLRSSRDGEDRTDTLNQIGVVDIAYSKRAVMADYLVAVQLTGTGELEPGLVSGYPRWSGSLWDLVARAITRVLYKSDDAPAPPKLDRRCAYATKMCAVIQSASLDSVGREVAQVEVLQPGKVRGEYHAVFQEDILGKREATFAYGCKVLNPADLLLRAICHALWGQETLGPRPRLVLPASIRLEGEDRFDLLSLDEPARTGFVRHRATVAPVENVPAMPKAADYVAFLQGRA